MDNLRPRQHKAVEDITSAGIYRQAQAGTLLVPTSPPTPKGESSDLGFFISTMAKPPFIGPLRKCSIEGCDQIARYVTVHFCGKHDMRIRRYGDPHHITSDQQRKINCREAALAYKPARPDVYRKRHNRHEHRVVAEQMLGRPLTSKDVVHHIDGNKHNNAPENLQVMSHSEHLKLHRAEMEAAKRAKHVR